MLLTALEIIAFMVAASIIGVILGWVLRGTLGREQVELGELRTQLRQLKKANRESKAALAATSSAVAETGASEVSEKSDTSEAPVKKARAKKAPAKAPVKKKVTTKAGKKVSVRKTQAARKADQAAGRAAFSEVINRVGASDEEDNLTKIHGVGKKYAGMLNDLGISSYQQISKLRKADIRTLAAALGVLDDRLEKEDWVGGAKALLKQAK